MIDAVDRLIMEREAMDHGLPGSVIVSVGGHGLLLGVLLLGHLLAPRQPVLNVMPGFVVPLPRGGGGTPNPAPVAPPAAKPKDEPKQEAPAPEPVKILKPPKDEPSKDALPEPEARRPKKTPKTPPPRTAPVPPGRSANETKPTPNAGPGGTGTQSALPGLEFAPAGPGVPSGTEAGGDWYLASVQQKIWILWTQQMKSGFNQPIGVTFTILADGSVADVQVTQPSNVTMLNLAAQRAVMSAAPFAPLPKTYGTNRYTIQATFKPTS